MPNTATQPRPAPPPRCAREAPRTRSAAPAAWLTLTALLALGLPLFLCSGVWPDITSYCLAARSIELGGICERDVLNSFKPPGMAWILIAIHQTLGWSPSALRLVDVVFVAAVAWSLANWYRPLGLSQAARVWIAVVLCVFYLGMTEWCHCQPDTWMMTPTLAALYLRGRQTVALMREGVPWSTAARRAFLEGLLGWGSACLLKPFVVVPAALCWLVTCACVVRASPRSYWPKLAGDTLGLLAGGLGGGLVWVAWLVLGGGWSYFIQDLHDWGGYFEHAPGYAQRTWYLFSQLWPWGLVHLLALPLALAALTRLGVRLFRSRRPGEPAHESPRPALLAAFYLGWMFQGNFVQYQFDYQVVPAVLVALALVGGTWGLALRRRSGHAKYRIREHPVVVWGLLLFAGYVVARHPLVNTKRLALWASCFREGSTPAVRDGLALDVTYYPPRQYIPEWQSLARVADYLRGRGVKDRELTCYSMHTMSLYLDLNVLPSTRHPFIGVLVWLYPHNHDMLRADLNGSPQRFVVSDLREIDVDYVPRDWGNPEPTLPTDLPYNPTTLFPWCESLVFRAGPYLVHEVTQPAGEMLNDLERKAQMEAERRAAEAEKKMERPASNP